MGRLSRFHSKNSGLTLVELLIAASIVTFVLAGLLRLFFYCHYLSRVSGDISAGMAEAQAKLEEMRGHQFEFITTDYGSGGTPGDTFDLGMLTGKGVIEITPINSQLLNVRIAVSLTSYHDLVLGEDKNLNGVQDAGEKDLFTSPMCLFTIIGNKN